MNFSEDLYLNFHAHQQKPDEKEIVIQSIFLQENLVTPKSDKIFFTSGLHPWHANLLNKHEIDLRLNSLIKSNSIVAIGETGIDKLKGPDVKTQTRVFIQHVEIAEKYNMPVIVHSVKAHNELLKLKKELKSKVPWVIHHFNGSKQMAFDLIDHGFYLSLSYHINNNSSRLSDYLSELPINKIFLETDDFDINIKDLYKIAAQKFEISIEELINQLMNNLKSLLNE
jgi:TatD DNase family protein